jgi:hypothetical protein
MAPGEASEQDPAFSVVRFSLSPEADEYSGSDVGVFIEKRTSIDWRRVVQLAVGHGVHPQVHHALDHADPSALPEGVPDTVIAELAERARATAAWNQFVLAELHRVRETFANDGIASLVFKGPVLGHLAYGHVQRRHSVDLDVLIRPGDMAVADATLLQQGYRRLNHDASPLRRNIRFFFQREHHYARGQLVYNLDIHTRPVTPRFDYPVSFDALYERALPVTIGDHTFETLSVEDLLHLLCYHGAKDRWARLKRICDVGKLIRSHPNLDWHAVWHRARATRSERIVALGLFVTSALYPLDLPDAVVDAIHEHPSMRTWARRLVDRLPHLVDDTPWGSAYERVSYPLVVQDGLPQRLRYAAYAGLAKLQQLVT